MPQRTVPGQRPEQQIAQHTAVDLRLEPLVRLGHMVEQDRAGRIQLPHLLPFMAGQPEELLQQTGLAQGELAVVGVQVEVPPWSRASGPASRS
ncbi:hypothetical protein ACFQV4_28895 [Streptomyces thermocarboxydus]